MGKVIITNSLREEIDRIFKAKSIEVLELIYSLEENPKRGKELTHIGNILVKELKYGTFRFYFITDGFKLKFLRDEEIKDLVLKFIRMSKKKDQQKTIDEIKILLKKLGYEAF
jgi:hypothetical protein